MRIPDLHTTTRFAENFPQVSVGVRGERIRPMRRSRVFAAVAVCLCFCGCVSWHTRADVSQSGFSPDKVCETRVPLILSWESGKGLGRRRALVVPPDVGVPSGGWRHSAPPVSNPWGACRHGDVCRNMGEITGVVPAGTRLRVEHGERLHSWNVWYGNQEETILFATIAFNGQPISVDINDISRLERNASGVRVPAPDTAVLQESP